MASTFESTSLVWIALSLWVGCAPGLPPEPPGKDAADPSAAVPDWKPSADPYRSSAFDGAKRSPSKGADHSHHHHGHHPSEKEKPK